MIDDHLLPRHDGVLGHHVGDPSSVDPQRVRAARVVEQDLGGVLMWMADHKLMFEVDDDEADYVGIESMCGG